MSKTLGLIAGASCIAGAFACYTATTWWTRRRREHRMKRGLRMEAKGERLLRRYGFHIEALQEPLEGRVIVGGKPITYQLRPDALVSRKGRRYVAEIKTGSVAGNPLSKETRRQLLEYQFFSERDSLLFVNADEGTLTEVRFDISKRKKGKGILLVAAGALFAGFITGRLL